MHGPENTERRFVASRVLDLTARPVPIVPPWRAVFLRRGALPSNEAPDDGRVVAMNSLWNGPIRRTGAILVCALALLPHDALGVAANAQIKAQSADASVPDPVEQGVMTISLNPSTLLEHVRGYLRQSGLYSDEVKAALSLPFIRQDLPVLVQTTWPNQRAAILGFTAGQDQSLSDSPRTSNCRVGKSGLWLCMNGNNAAQAASLEAIYTQTKLSHDLRVQIPSTASEAFAGLVTFRDQVPDTAKRLLERVPALAGDATAVSLVESWLYGVHHDLLHQLTRLMPTEFSFDVEPDGSYHGYGLGIHAAPAPLQAALQSTRARKPSALLRLFPVNTKMLLSTDARLLGDLSLSSALGANAFAGAVSIQSPKMAEVLGRLLEIRQKCLMRSQDLVVAFGKTSDFSSAAPKKLAPKGKTAIEADSDYMALGITDRDAQCHDAVAAYLAPSTYAGSINTQPTLRLPNGVVTVEHIGQVTWFVLGTDVRATSLVRKTLASRPRAEQLEMGDAPAALHIRSRIIEEPATGGPSSASLSRSSFMTLQLRLDENKLGFSMQTTKGAVHQVLIQALFNFAGTEHTRAAAELLHAACTLGSAGGCNDAGVAYLEWQGVSDRSKALHLLEKGCQYDHPMSCANWGTALQNDRPLEASKAFSRGCDLGSPLACSSLGGVLLDSNDAANHKQANEKLTMACEHDLAIACTNLGYQYMQGRGVTADEAKGVDYYGRACKLNSGLGCVLLGHTYVRDGSRARDPVKALGLYRKACELKQPLGCHFAGTMLLGNGGVPTDDKTARQYLARACDDGHAESCRVLGDLAGGTAR